MTVPIPLQNFEDTGQAQYQGKLANDNATMVPEISDPNFILCLSVKCLVADPQL